jgi:hypothetical protein
MSPLTEENLEDHTRPFKLEEFIELRRQSDPTYPYGSDPIGYGLTYAVTELLQAGYRPVLHKGGRLRATRNGLPDGYYFEFRPEIKRLDRCEREKLTIPEELQRATEFTRWLRNYRRRLRRIEQRERQHFQRAKR